VASQCSEDLRLTNKPDHTDGTVFQKTKGHAHLKNVALMFNTIFHSRAHLHPTTQKSRVSGPGAVPHEFGKLKTTLLELQGSRRSQFS
jgi:hypothetical protein